MWTRLKRIFYWFIYIGTTKYVIKHCYDKLMKRLQLLQFVSTPLLLVLQFAPTCSSFPCSSSSACSVKIAHFPGRLFLPRFPYLMSTLQSHFLPIVYGTAYLHWNTAPPSDSSHIRAAVNISTATKPNRVLGLPQPHIDCSVYLTPRQYRRTISQQRSGFLTLPARIKIISATPTTSTEMTTEVLTSTPSTSSSSQQIIGFSSQLTWRSNQWIIITLWPGSRYSVTLHRRVSAPVFLGKIHLKINWSINLALSCINDRSSLSIILGLGWITLSWVKINRTPEVKNKRKRFILAVLTLTY